MTNAQNPFKLERFGNIKKTREQEFDLKYHAMMHETNRQHVVASILLELYLMAAKGFIRQGSAVKLQRAVAQELSGAKQQATEPAHCMPRQILIGTQTPQNILQDAFPSRALVVDSFFSLTDFLPANFHQADLLASDNGLREGFRFACQTVIFKAQLLNKMEYETVAVSVKSTYALYETRAHEAFLASLKMLKDKFQFRLPPKEDKKWREQMEIMRVYDQTLMKSVSLHEVLDIHEVKKLIALYQ